MLVKELVKMLKEEQNLPILINGLEKQIRVTVSIYRDGVFLNDCYSSLKPYYSYQEAYNLADDLENTNQPEMEVFIGLGYPLSIKGIVVNKNAINLVS